MQYIAVNRLPHRTDNVRQNPMNECGARTRSGTPCKRPGNGAGGRCHFHGGRSTGRPMVSGRYSVVHRKSLQTKMATMAADPAPGELWEELALQRALLSDYLDRFPDGQAMPADDITRMFDWLGDIGRQTERIHKIMQNSALTTMEVGYLQAKIADLLQRYLPDDKRQAFLAELAEATGGKVAAADNDTVIRVEYADSQRGQTDDRVRVYIPHNGRNALDVTKLSDEELQAIVDGR